MPKSNNKRRGSRKQAGQRTARSGNVQAVSPWSSATRNTVEVKLYSQAASNSALYHNTAHLYANVTNLFDAIGQGTGAFQRLGNQVFVRNMILRMVLNRKTDRPNVSYRVIVVATVPGNGADSFDELFDGAAFTGIQFPGVSQVLHDVTFPRDQGGVMTQQATPDKERSNTIEIAVPVNRTVAWSKSATALTSLRVYIVAYDAYGTLTTDNIASIAQGTLGIYFQDS